MLHARFADLPQALRAVARASDAAQERVARALDAWALRIDGSAKRRAPVDTGRLRASYGWSAPEPLAREVGTNVTYAPHQEYGTRTQAGTPHLRPAFDAERERGVASIRRAVEVGT